MKLSFFIIVVTILCSACSTQPKKKITDYLPINYKNIYLYSTAIDDSNLAVARDSSVMGSARDVLIYINGKISATIGSGVIAYFKIPQGENIVGVSFDRTHIPKPTSEIKISTDSVKKTTLRISLKYGEDDPFIQKNTWADFN